MSQICQKQAQHFAKQEINCQKLPKTSKILPKWRNFAKSDHTDLDKYPTDEFPK